MRKIRVWLFVFIVGLVLSGVTAFPLEHELRVLDALTLPGPLEGFIHRVSEGIIETNDRWPFIMYGTDWLAFAHLVIAVAFIGPWRDPVRNIWIIQWAMIACVGVVPLALLAGPVRDIPFWWSLIDMSFGVFGIIPLLVVHRLIRRLEAHQTAPEKPLPMASIAG